MVIDALQIGRSLMSDLRVTNLKGRTSGSAPNLPDGVVVSGISTFNNEITVDGGDITLT